MISLQRLGTDWLGTLNLRHCLALSNSGQLNLGLDGLGALGIVLTSDHTTHVNRQQEQQTHDLFILCLRRTLYS